MDLNYMAESRKCKMAGKKESNLPTKIVEVVKWQVKRSENYLPK